MITAYTLIYASLLIIPGCLQLADANTSLLLGPAGRVEGVLSSFSPRPFLLHLCSQTKKTGIRCPPGSVPALPRAETDGWRGS